ncbi:ATP-binding protein [Sphingomonas sp. PAMC 26605]|uniref:ATP-binding protein n=1 Tax=Sphingomonas sp. PAMC 26605 TaxID=1112214 RepID=UPI00026CCA3B|nr:ATP-binding protein [Sphingomonas sp. PAMC 26605]
MSDALLDPVIAAAQAARSGDGPVPVFVLCAGPGDATWLVEQLRARGELVCHADLRRLPAHAAARDRAMLWTRTAIIDGAVLVVSDLDTLGARERSDIEQTLLAASPHIPVLVLQSRSLAPELAAQARHGLRTLEPSPASRSMRAAIWYRRAAEAGLALSPADARLLGSTYGFEREQIEATIALADIADSETATDIQAVTLRALRRAARQTARADVPSNVRWIDTPLRWDDLVLPQPVKRELRAIAVQVQQGAQVWDDWGFARRTPYGQGVAALFAGPSGTGKTMAAQIIAGEMGVPLFHVDLAQTVSKYIGETEKMLARIFEGAARSGAVLLFDEADALFGKRSEVKDAHDRHANIEVAYLLQQMEEYRGLAILTTNAKHNVDAAFLRRLRFVVDFPLPEAAERLAIWQGMFPETAPLAADVDLTFLARQLPLTGGSIQQIVLRAAFDAAADGAIGMAHLLSATRHELTKLGLRSAERFIAEAAPRAEAAA